MGVSLALKKLETAIASQLHRHIRTLGPIIHNTNANDAQKDDYVLIRAHGVPREVEKRLKTACASVEDATCPKVKKAQLAIAKATARGASLLLFGEAEHPEVAGLVSFSHAKAYVFGSQLELDHCDFDASKGIVLASQTTQDKAAFERIAETMQKRHKNLKVLSTICDATRQRQLEALRIAAQVDVMVVIGGKSSGNTRRLASLASEAGIQTFHVETAEELNIEDFSGKKAAGLTAGASTPENLIDAAEIWLQSI